MDQETAAGIDKRQHDQDAAEIEGLCRRSQNPDRQNCFDARWRSTADSDDATLNNLTTFKWDQISSMIGENGIRCAAHNASRISYLKDFIRDDDEFRH
jgi:hypothetical protein